MEFVILGALGFWLFAAFVALVLMALIANERPGWATLFFLAAAFATNYLTGVKVFDWVSENPLGAALVILAYLAIGVVWSIAKWAFFVYAERRAYDRMKTDFLLARQCGNSSGAVPKELQGDWGRYIAHRRFPPHAAHNKTRIVTWMAFWPWSLVWTMIDDPIKRIFEFLYRRIQTLLEGISKRAFQGTESDFADLTEKIEADAADQDI